MSSCTCAPYKEKHIMWSGSTDSDKMTISETQYEMITFGKEGKLGTLVVGVGGSNGSTLVASLLAHRQGLTWETKEGTQGVEFLGSLSQCGTVPMGHVGTTARALQFKQLGDLFDPSEIVIGGWDICKDDLYTANKNARVMDPALLNQMESKLKAIKPWPGIFNEDFIATNQKLRADNVIHRDSLREYIEVIKQNIADFKEEKDLSKVVVLWSASTERMHKGTWQDKAALDQAIEDNDPEISPSVLFAVAALESKCIFLNGSPQNTICPAVISTAKHFDTHVGGEDFKTGQTKLKSALVDWLAGSAVRPLSIVSYNHLGNNDGKNLSETPQFRSKEITKKNVIDDVVEENRLLFPDGKGPDHVVVIKYVPAVKDSKRAMDEYYSELFLNGRHTLAIHNTCEDTLLAVPLMLDLVIFSEFFARFKFLPMDQGAAEAAPFGPVLSLLSFFFKAPATNEGEPVINSFFRQRLALENFFRALIGAPTNDYIDLKARLGDPSAPIG